MNLMQFYESLPKPEPPKTTFVKNVAERCGVDVSTVRWWVKGRTKPSNKQHYDILSEATGIPKNQLFPNEND